MALNFEQKKAVVAEVADVAKVALAAVAVEYRGITVEEMTDLRAKARESPAPLAHPGRPHKPTAGLPTTPCDLLTMRCFFNFT